MKVTVCACTTFILFSFSFFFLFFFFEPTLSRCCCGDGDVTKPQTSWTMAGQDQTAVVSADTEASGSSHKLLVQPLRAADAGCQSVGVSCQTTLCQLQLSLLTLQNMEEDFQKNCARLPIFFHQSKSLLDGLMFKKN